MDGWFPQITDKETGITYAFGSTVQAHLLRLGPLSLLARGGVYSIRTDADISMFYLGGAAGLGYFTPLSERLGVGAFGFAGLGQIPDVKTPGIEEKSYGLYELGARLSASLRLSASMNLDLFAGYQRLATPVNSFIDAPAVGIGLRIAPGELLRSRGHLDFGQIKADPVFPVLRSWYDSEPLGTVTIENREDGPIEKVRVFFYVPEYMGGSRLCADLPRLDPGEKLEVPLYAVFDERILSLTENSRTNALVDVEYSFYGSERTAAETFPLSIYHRNTMTWEDDRRAAAFVSPTDPASLWFARYSGSIARDRMRGNLPRNLQHALSIFEGLRLYGVNYVIDPNSAYEELSEDATAIDFLQYPSETLMYRGGDCDDLSILYSSLLESAGISTAFITIPGHIYMAFDLGLSEEEAREQFFDPGLLIIRDGSAWAPIEITMVREGFVKAWRVGAKQWIDNDAAGRADFFPMRENWKRYPPSALPGAESRFVLPEESELMVAFDGSINRFMTREIGPVISEFRQRLDRERDPETLNEYGVALAKAGMLDESWEQFAEAADGGYVWAWNNLANIAFIRKDYDLAHSYYEWAEELLPDDPVATLGLARSAYEMDRYRESERLYNRLLAGAPSLADRFNYLQSVYGGAGRAYSMTDRLTSTVWSEKDLDFGPAVDKLAVDEAPEAEAEASAGAEVELAAAEEPEPEAEPDADLERESEAEVELEQETAFEAESESEIEIESEPEPEPEPERVAEINLELPSGEDQEQEELILDEGEASEPEEDSKATASAAADEQEEPAAAPPGIERKAPVDSEIASLMQLSQQNVLSARVVPPPEEGAEAAEEAAEKERSSAAPPTIAEKAPEDIEVAQRRVEDKTRIVEPPEEDPEPVPEEREEETELDLEPVPQPVSQTEDTIESEEEEPAPKSEPETETEPDQTVRVAQAEPAPEPEQEPEPPLEPEPEPESEPDIDTEPEKEPVLDTEPEPAPVQKGRVKLVGPEVRTPTGKWALGDYFAEMTDEGAYYAKLVLPPQPIAGPAEYSFKARSTGSGLAGFGIHIHGQEDSDKWKWRFTQFGGGDSILIWITSDPKHYGDAAPRLQLYRSYGEVAMEMTDSVQIPGSAFDLRDYSIAYDPEAGTIGVSVDGTEYLSAGGFANSESFDYILLRALDTAEFRDLSVQPLHKDDEEKRDE